ncbi:hypothetical protein WJX81_002754 [Elliptochloris bilobata]|uniref:Transcription factor IIIC 90kDa subunit N-terminal domain-containing protein n=1 Tax=Elliptochloris bilobata TaxID=381761 RepID=A0AAW1RFU5_9CHLO
MAQAVTLRAQQTWAGPPTSPICGFWLPELPSVHFCAYGTADARVVVQQLTAGRDAEEAQGEGVAARVPQLLLELQTASGQRVATDAAQVAWAEAGGAFLLAAAAGGTLAVFSLQRYLLRLSGDAEAADGLLSAEARGGVAMHRLVGGPLNGGGPAALELLWRADAGVPQVLLSAGAHALSPAASAAAGAKVATVWGGRTGNGGMRLGAPAAGDAAEHAAVAAEELRHPAPVVSLQWSPGVLQNAVGDDGGGAALLPGSQAALLTAAADGALRVWVEVTLAPVLGTDGAAPGWQSGSAAPSSGQERLLLWAVDGLAGVVLSGRPGTAGGGSGGLRTPRAVLWGQHAGQLAWPPHQVLGARGALAAVVAVEEDAPVLHVLESRAAPCPGTQPCRGAGAGGAADVRAFRLETVEDAMALPSALQLPHPPGGPLPMRALLLHGLRPACACFAWRKRGALPQRAARQEGSVLALWELRAERTGADTLEHDTLASGAAARRGALRGWQAVAALTGGPVLACVAGAPGAGFNVLAGDAAGGVHLLALAQEPGGEAGCLICLAHLAAAHAGPVAGVAAMRGGHWLAAARWQSPARAWA